MEYTSLLAGEPFSDAPSCVDGELAAVMRHANDKMSAADRPRLVPLLGRSIGLAVPEPMVARPPRRRRRPNGDWDLAAMADHAAAVGRLRQGASRRFTTALGLELTGAESIEYAHGRDLNRLFWSLMVEPVPVSTSAAYVDRLIGRLVLLHQCYEQAMEELGLRRTMSAQQEPQVSSS